MVLPSQLGVQAGSTFKGLGKSSGLRVRGLGFRVEGCSRKVRLAWGLTLSSISVQCRFSDHSLKGGTHLCKTRSSMACKKCSVGDRQI